MVPFRVRISCTIHDIRCFTGNNEVIVFGLEFALSRMKHLIVPAVMSADAVPHEAGATAFRELREKTEE
jgi:hypothetical protein